MNKKYISIMILILIFLIEIFIITSDTTLRPQKRQFMIIKLIKHDDYNLNAALYVLKSSIRDKNKKYIVINDTTLKLFPIQSDSVNKLISDFNSISKYFLTKFEYSIYEK